MAVEITKPGYREFNALKSDGTRIKLSVRLPFQKELQYADIEMSVAFNRCQAAGLPVRARLLRNLKEAEQWTDKDQNELNDLRSRLKLAQDEATKLFTNRAKLEEASAKDPVAIAAIDEQVTKASVELQEARQLFGERVEEFNSMVRHTADEKADVAYRNFLIACVVERVENEGAIKKGSRYFADLDAFLNCDDPTLLERIAYEFNVCQNGMVSEWTTADNEEAAAKTKADADKAANDLKEAQALAALQAASTEAVATLAIQPPADASPSGEAPVAAAVVEVTPAIAA